jgi:glycosyltransferase involved in cell wall biosynthesis
MKIGVLTHNYPRFQGDFSGRFVEALSEELVDQGHSVTILAPWDPAYARQAGDHRVKFVLYRYALRADWHQLGYMRTMRADMAMRPLAYFLAPGLFAVGAATVLRWVGQERPDVLHAHWALPNGYLGALANRRCGVPLVVSIPGSDATVAAQNPVFGRMAGYAFHRAGLVTANSESLRDVAIDRLGADPARFELIAYGVDPQALRPDPAGTAELRAALGIPSSAVALLAVGRMVYKKGFDVLLQAAALLDSVMREAVGPDCAVPEVHLVMIGDGDLWAAWQALGRELGLGERVHWVGSVPMDRIAPYYNLADIAVMPAVTKPADGLAVAVLDAMSCAKPVVGSDASGNGIAILDGINGYLVPERDPAALAQVLARLIVDPALRHCMGVASRRLIDTELGWPQLARRYADHFARLARERRP